MYEQRLRLNQKFLAHAAKVNALPCRFSDCGQRITFKITRWRSICWHIQFYFSLVYCVYINVRLVERILWPADFKYYELGTHFSRAFLATPFSHWAYEIFLKHPFDEQVLYNYALSGPMKQQQQLSPQDQLLISLPFNLYPFCLFFSAIFLWDSSQNQFLYAAIPVLHRLDSMVIKAAFAILESYMFLMWMAAGHFETFLSITFMQRVENDLAANAQMGKPPKDRRNGREWLREGYRAARMAHLGVSMFNTCNSGVIFSQKLLCLFGSVMGMYVFVALVRVSPLVSAMFAVFFMNSNLFYWLVWGGAYRIPATLATLLHNLRMEVPTIIMGKELLHYYKRKLRSVPRIGLKAGSFRQVERNSRLIFVDFVATNVAMMLISFKDHY